MTDAGEASIPVRIFISYRREDSEDATGRLYDALLAQFGAECLFMDIDTIPLGVDFTKVITEAVSSCDVLVAVIGKQWLTIADSNGQRRLENPEDFVRLEIRAALERDVRVIPALVQGAEMPGSQELPADIAALARRNGIILRADSFRHGVARVIAPVEQVGQEMTERERLETERLAGEAAVRKQAEAERREQERDAEPLVRGNELGLPPGPEIGRLLALIEEERAAGRISTREEALDLARRELMRPWEVGAENRPLPGGQRREQERRLHEREASAQREREAQAQREREAQAQREREAQAQRERQAREAAARGQAAQRPPAKSEGVSAGKVAFWTGAVVIYVVTGIAVGVVAFFIANKLFGLSSGLSVVIAVLWPIGAFVYSKLEGQ